MEKPDPSGALNDDSQQNQQPDLIEWFLKSQNNRSTRRAYETDLGDFWSGIVTDAELETFLSLPPSIHLQRLAGYEDHLRGRGLSSSTIRRRLTTVKRFIAWTQGNSRLRLPLGSFQPVLKTTASKRSLRAADDSSTASLSVEKEAQLLALPDASNEQGVRDVAILLLAVENALNRAEICALNRDDFDTTAKVLIVPLKGHADNRIALPLRDRTFRALMAHTENLSQEPQESYPAPLFHSIKKGRKVSGGRLTIDGIYHLVRSYGKALGEPNLSSRRLHHSAIVRVLSEVEGDIHRAQTMLPHISLATLQRYRSELGANN